MNDDPIMKEVDYNRLEGVLEGILIIEDNIEALTHNDISLRLSNIRDTLESVLGAIAARGDGVDLEDDVDVGGLE